MSERIELGKVLVAIDDEARTVTSEWPDGTRLVAKPENTAESVARALALGYDSIAVSRSGEDVRPGETMGERVVWEMTRDHDLLHHVVARAEGLPWSWHLYRVAWEGHPLDEGIPEADGDREERLVLLLQAGMNGGRTAIVNGTNEGS